ncbi:hypothetical protein HPP92_014812 [Vanilla planifolia]|uniref:Uncharacterized protein n=1 Tax=Vanilla planifolia TaxID=51239 RepID=A0A835QGQ0_VANPL|nr:hypothetical protein HPP92_014812 [Vanilla planifolia]
MMDVRDMRHNWRTALREKDRGSEQGEGRETLTDGHSRAGESRMVESEGQWKRWQAQGVEAK